MTSATDKEIFKQLQHQAREITGKGDFALAFPFLCLQIFFPNLTEEEINEAIEGLGSNDEGIDAFWIDKEEEVIYIAQFKSSVSYKKIEESTAKKEWFSLLAEVPHKLRDKEFINQHKNSRIRDSIGYDFRAALKSNYRIESYLFHLGQASENVIKNYPQIRYVGFDDIKQQWLKYQSMTSQTLPKECELNVDYLNDPTKPHILAYTAKYSGREKKTFLTILTGSELINLMKQYQWQLFDRNIRFYLGANNKINQKIIDSAIHTPDIFYCFNNGITLTCTRCRYKEERSRIVLESPQIINGAQTMNSLYEAYQRLYKANLANQGYVASERAEAITEQHFGKVKILCRIVESTKSDDTEFAVNLTRYNNSQNDVRIFDFFSNNPEQEEIQRKMLSYGYFYERKRGERNYFKKSKGKILRSNKGIADLEYASVKIDIRKMASVFQAYNGKPSYQECDYRNILESKTQEAYNNLFGRKTEITDNKIKQMILAINIYDAIQSQVKAYTTCLRVLEAMRLEPNDISLLERFKETAQKILFWGDKMQSSIWNANSYSDIKNIETYITKFNILTRASYLMTALVKYILVQNQYLDGILNTKLFADPNFIKEKIVVVWLRHLFGYIQETFKEESGQTPVSTESFYKRQGIYDKVIGKIEEKVYVDNNDLQAEFPLSLS